MHGLYREQRFAGSAPVSRDLAKHLYTRMMCGKVAVVTDKPASMLAAVRKQWMQIERQLRRERSSTLDATRILELTYEIPRMQSMVFTAKAPIDEPQADVLFATADDFLKWPPQCRTMYVTCAVELEVLYQITAWMAVHGLVVMYAP
ncbi:MAG TPA: hypothetical protein VF466_05230 [Candidatus Saccharimonadales bacterium]